MNTTDTSEATDRLAGTGHSLSSAVTPTSVTVGDVRRAVSGLADDVPLTVAVRADHHVDHLLGEFPVVRVGVTAGVTGSVVVLDVLGVS